MKKTFGLISLVVVTMMLIGGAAQAQLLFSDNFNVSAFNTDIDFEYNSGTRQSGTLAPLTWTEVEGPIGDPNPSWWVWRASFYINGNEDALTLISNSASPWAMASPDYDFGVYNDLEVEFDLDPITPWSDNAAGTGFVGLTFGSPGPGEYPSQTPTGMGLALYSNGTFNVFGPRLDAEPDLVTTANVGAKSGYYHVKLAISQAGEDSLVSIFVDGVSVLDNYTKAGGFSSNYLNFASMSLDDTNNMFAVDNLSVTAVPEPGSMLALGSGLVGLLGFAIRRRR